MSAINTSSDIQWLKQQNILIYGGIQGGLGDVSATIKLFNIFQKYVPKDQIALYFPNADRPKLVSFQDKIDKIKVIYDSGTENCYNEIANFKPSYMVAFHLPKQNEFAIRYSTHVPLIIPTLAFEEYQWTNLTQTPMIQHHSLGLYCEAPPPLVQGIGIFQSKKLKRYALESIVIPPISKPSKCIPKAENADN